MESAHYKKRRDCYDWLTLGVAATGVIVVIAYTIVTYCLLSANRASNQRQFRAFVNLEKVVIPKAYTTPADKTHLYLTAVWANGGGSETVELAIETGCSIEAPERALPFDDPRWYHSVNHWVIGPHSHAELTACPVDADKNNPVMDNITQWEKQNNPVFVYGRATYRDVYMGSADKAHVTEFCVLLNNMKGHPSKGDFTADITGWGEHNCSDSGCRDFHK